MFSTSIPGEPGHQSLYDESWGIDNLTLRSTTDFAVNASGGRNGDLRVPVSFFRLFSKFRESDLALSL